MWSKHTGLYTGMNQWACRHERMVILSYSYIGLPYRALTTCVSVCVCVSINSHIIYSPLPQSQLPGMSLSHRPAFLWSTSIQRGLILPGYSLSLSHFLKQSGLEDPTDQHNLITLFGFSLNKAWIIYSTFWPSAWPSSSLCVPTVACSAFVLLWLAIWCWY